MIAIALFYSQRSQSGIFVVPVYCAPKSDAYGGLRLRFRGVTFPLRIFWGRSPKRCLSSLDFQETGDRSDHGDTGYDCCVENQGLMSYSVQDLSLRVQGG
ncbi:MULTISPECIES: hypothetical protein [Nostoc]|uniref:Uncharacterized protein n=1 Tax=Nostoc paludosum FACHB-159 TaxID=2692908 RepID=A0ABR8KI17_9NOSO|nr:MULTISPECIES: hypothetical protein [Nostoc]MBD2682868.1 hypothetical protein [Nostoc sp. FACHB-857]MBD2739205.1 hypothetical protein [Nostoc paludosum FACHB-159]